MKGRRAITLLFLVAVAAAAIALVVLGKRVPPHSPEQLVPTTWTDARETPMHRFHVGTKKIGCAECHGATETPGAASAVAAASCTKCHEREERLGHIRSKRDVGASHADEPTCLSCHVFGANKPAATCNGCHAADHRVAGAPALEHHASKDLPCAACHWVHGEERAVLPDCTVCHRATSARHGRFAAAPSLDAGPAGAFLPEAAVLAFAREAGAPASAFATHDPHASFLALRPGEVCSTCHAPHAGKEAARASCGACHLDAHAPPGAPMLSAKAPHVAPGGPRVAGHDACVTCHDPHAARRSDVRSCQGCHADHRGASEVSGHATCTGCHAPHAPTEARTACAGCHAEVATLGVHGKAAPAGAHADCTSCHDPHRPERPPGQACVGCHAQTKPSHPTFASKGGPSACTGCHAPHRKDPRDAAVAVATACTSCHGSVGANDHAAHAQKAACAACHAPHDFQLANLGAPLCARCHADRAAKTSSLPGHARCEGCHQTAHAPVAKPSCQGCHADEVRTAPTGHASCTSCHDAHSGFLGTHASCTSCHETKAKSLHGGVPNGCASCHRAHGRTGAPSVSPPSCTACHAQPSLQGLHGLRDHGTCTTCHAAHGPPRADRATCTGSCHTDRRGHQPEAKVCSGCHLFRQ